MIVGGYDLHLYCDNVPADRPWAPGDVHDWDEFPHTNFGNFECGSEARSMARSLGWLLNLNTGRARCPKCNPRRKSAMNDKIAIALAEFDRRAAEISRLQTALSLSEARGERLAGALEHLTELFSDLAPLGDDTPREVALVNARQALADFRSEKP